jgi:hypothetical protein
MKPDAKSHERLPDPTAPPPWVERNDAKEEGSEEVLEENGFRRLPTFLESKSKPNGCKSPCQSCGKRSHFSGHGEGRIRSLKE